MNIAGAAFYLRAAGLLFNRVAGLSAAHRPDTTRRGIALSWYSIVFVWLLVRFECRAASVLEPPALAAGAYCSQTCFFPLRVMLAAPPGDELTGRF